MIWIRPRAHDGNGTARPGALCLMAGQEHIAIGMRRPA